MSIIHLLCNQKPKSACPRNEPVPALCELLERCSSPSLQLPLWCASVAAGSPQTPSLARAEGNDNGRAYARLAPLPLQTVHKDHRPQHPNPNTGSKTHSLVGNLLSSVTEPPRDTPDTAYDSRTVPPGQP